MSEATPTLRHRLADNVRALRQERGWSQEDLAEHTKMHHTQISKLERSLHSVGIDVIEKLAAAFDVPPTRLFE